YYTSKGDLWTVSAAGGNPQRVIRDVGSASISPDGRALVFSRGGVGAEALWVASPPDAEPKEDPLPARPSQVASLRGLQFAPDGSKFGFFLSQQAGAAEPQFWICGYPSGSAGPSPLQTADFLNAADHFSWMPDSRHIVFASSLPRRSSR